MRGRCNYTYILCN